MKGRHYLAIFIFLLLGVQNFTRAEESLTPITLQLHWNHQFQFAGYYAALMKGYYRQAGLAVTIKDGGYNEAGHALQPEVEVLFNRAQFGTTRTDILINHSEGLPVVVVANIMQHSPLIFLSIEKYGIERLEDIGYQRPVSLNINTRSDNRIDAEAVAALKLAGLDLNKLNNSSPSWLLQDLLKGKTELTPAYSTDEPYFVSRAGEKAVMIAPVDYGIDFYGDLLFTSQYMLDSQPDIVKKFRQASLRGWKYAMENPANVIDHIVDNYDTRTTEYDKTFLRYEAQRIRDLINSDVIEIGYINRDRWYKIAQTYQTLGLIREFDLDSFLYAPDSKDIWSIYDAWIIPIALFIVFIIAILIYFYLLTKHLKIEIKKRHEAESKLKIQAQLDGLTGIDNRYMFERNLEREFNHSRRYRQPLVIMMIDIDDFKVINDRYGHLAGDDVLKSFVTVSKRTLRNSDIFARYGGEEFVVLLPATSIDEAMSLGNRVIQNNRENTVIYEGRAINYTISIGVAELDEQDQDSRDLLNRSDKSMYRAKQSGKDRIIEYAA